MKRIHQILRHGFTLIELLVVISIIAILAGLTLSMVDYAQNKAKRDRTSAEISALELALESYKVDNGDYPRSTTTDSIATTTETSKDYATKTSMPATSASASLILYETLSGDTNHDRKVDTDSSSGTKNHVYFPFKPGMLYPNGGTGNVTALVDSFGNIYGYSTIGSGTDTTSTTKGYNPTFDLWSTNDPGKTGTSGTATRIKNW